MADSGAAFPGSPAPTDGFHPEGLRLLLSVVHGLSLRRSLSGDGPHLGAQQVVGGLWGAALERFGILGRDVLEHWNLDTPEKVGEAISHLVATGFLQGSEDEMADYQSLSGQEAWPDPPRPRSVRERPGWGGF
jgi:uncharacterized repeat protein (TIGR04138 family)